MPDAFRSPDRALTSTATAALHTEATTVLSFHYKDGVLIAGDRRATAGNIIMYDRADKVIELDQDTIIAIAGSPAVAFEMARTLQTSFQYYRRSQLQALSLSAKVRALGKLIKDNLPMTLQGVGAVVPILAARDAQHQKDPTLYFYDALGAQFLSADFSVSGSGSPAARSILQWINRWSGEPTNQRGEKAAVQLALQLLDVAAESDSATGGVDRRSHVFPQVKLLTRDGLRSVSVETLRECFTALEAAQK
jgi:proteasome beta subunit